MSSQAGPERKTIAGRLLLIAAMAATMAVAGWLGAGCSVSKAVLGSRETTVAPTTSLPAKGATDTSGQSTTNTTRLVEGGKTSEAYASEIPGLQKAADASPRDVTALQNLAVAQYNAGKYDAAGATYLRMLQIKDDPTTRNNYGNVLRDQGNFDEAKTEYQKAISGDPALAVAYINLAGVLALKGNASDAQKVLDQGVAHTTGSDKQRLLTYKTTLSKAK
jgi:Flp pilus assembly protein TadD